MAHDYLSGVYPIIPICLSEVCNHGISFCSWATTYEDLLCSTEPFQQPIALAVNFLEHILSNIIAFETILVCPFLSGCICRRWWTF